MSVRHKTSIVLAVLGLAALAAAVAALANQQSTVKRQSTVAARPPCAPPSPGTHQIVVEPGRAAVLLHVPRHAFDGRRPLVLVLPGAGMTGRDMARYTGYSKLADIKGFLVAYPTASGSRPFWNVSTSQAGKPDDVAYLRKVITSLTATGCADPARVGVTGVSNGGGMSALMACQAADLLAAAAPVAGGYKSLPDCEPARPLPMLEIHGLRDEVVPYTGTRDASHAGAVGPFLDEWRARDRCPNPPRRTNPAHNVQELRWKCADGRVVEHYRVLDAEHGWPGESSLRPFSSTVRTWRFISAFHDEFQHG